MAERYKRTRVSIDGTPDFEADVELGKAGEIIRWNGFVGNPWFSREEAQKVIDWVHETNGSPTPVECSRFVWVDDLLVQVDWNGEPGDPPVFTAEVLHPDRLGRYCIGGWSWTWTEVETCSGCGAPERDHLSADECGDHGIDTRDGLGCAVIVRRLICAELECSSAAMHGSIYCADHNGVVPDC